LTTPNNLNEAILFMARQPARRRQMAVAARQASHRFDIRQTVQHSLALYTNDCTKRSPPRKWKHRLSSVVHGHF
jgi:hypothetical protein